MTFDPNEVLNFDFGDVEPAAPGMFVLIPSGEYQVQCIGGRKYFTGETSEKAGDPNKPNLEFKFSIINHPLYEGMELKLSHSLGSSSRQFLLNTLMCLIPDKPWQQSGIQIPLGALLQAIQGRTTNSIVFHDDFKGKEGNTVYIAKIKGLKKFDPTVPAPMPTDTNPPRYMLEKNPTSPVQQQAAQGVVSPEETQQFINQWPGGSPPPAAPPSTQGTAIDFGF